MPFSGLRGMHNPFASASSRRHGQEQDNEAYHPPPGPPPTYEGIRPHSGPESSFASHPESGQSSTPTKLQVEETYEPPPGPPPAHDDAPPPYHDWQSVPDTALLPPPPSLGHDFSPASNACEGDADRAKLWCQQYPLANPHQPLASQVNAVRQGNVALLKPGGHPGSMRSRGVGHWNITTTTDSSDSCFMTSLPLYFVAVDSPLHTEVPKTIYYELKINSLGRRRDGDPSTVALGFCAWPYPSFRMPGWERGSLAIHSDDGRRFVNDDTGGKDFTGPITAGETVGIGISFSLARSETPTGTRYGLKGEAFFTRNSQKTDGWDLHEELDEADRLGIVGIDGKYDLFAAIGIFGRVSVDILFRRDLWLFRP